MSKEAKFWDWFIEYKNVYANLDRFNEIEREDRLNSLLGRLHRYNKNLFFQLGFDTKNSLNELVITAEGDTTYFTQVKQLVNLAPVIDGWNIVALKPPMGMDFTTEYEGLLLEPHKIWFLPLETKNDSNLVGLKICVPNYNPALEELYLEAVFQVLDTLVGEEILAITIQHVEVDSLPENPEEDGLLELKDLPAYIKWKTSKTPG